MKGKSTLPPLPAGLRAKAAGDSITSGVGFRPGLFAACLLVLFAGVILVLPGRTNGDEGLILGSACCAAFFINAIASGGWQDRPRQGLHRLLAELPLLLLAMLVVVAVVPVLMVLAALVYSMLAASVYLAGAALVVLLLLVWLTKTLKSPGGLGLRGPQSYSDGKHWSGRFDR